jgi:hypothetical protein
MARATGGGLQKGTIMRALRVIAQTISVSVLLTSAMACDQVEVTDSTHEEGGKGDSLPDPTELFNRLGGSYYAFDGANWYVLMLTRPYEGFGALQGVGTGTYQATAGAYTWRDSYTVTAGSEPGTGELVLNVNGFVPSEIRVPFRLVRAEIGIHSIPDTLLVNLFSKLSPDLEHFEGALYRGPLFCEREGDCHAQTGFHDGDVEAPNWQCNYNMCTVPSVFEPY